MGNKTVVASQRRIARNIGYMGGSPVLGVAFLFLKAEDSLIPKELTKK